MKIKIIFDTSINGEAVLTGAIVDAPERDARVLLANKLAVPVPEEAAEEVAEESTLEEAAEEPAPRKRK